MPKPPMQKTPMQNTKYKRVLLKVSGEGLCRAGGFGIDGTALDRIAGQIREVTATGVQLAIVPGGGNFLRGTTLAKDTAIQPATAHYMGMLSTVLNALALQDTLERLDIKTRVLSAIAIDRVCEKFIRRRCIRHLEKGRVVILASGTGDPFVTTDTAAALRAAELNADVILKATKVDGIYSDDPEKVPDATRYTRLTYDQVIDQRLEVMDFGAINMCRENGVAIVVFTLREDGNMKRVVLGEDVGTTITDA